MLLYLPRIDRDRRAVLYLWRRSWRLALLLYLTWIDGVSLL